jgi:hypothetical protein
MWVVKEIDWIERVKGHLMVTHKNQGDRPEYDRLVERLYRFIRRSLVFIVLNNGIGNGGG